MKVVSPISCDTKPDSGFLSEDGKLAFQHYIGSSVSFPPIMA